VAKLVEALRYSRKVAGSIPSGRTTALGSTQTLKEITTMNINEG
jgi:hypothetical protein